MIDREEAYIEIGRIEDLVSMLEFATNRHKEIFIDWAELDKCVEGAEKLYAYVRTSNDEQIMIDCCKIDRRFLGRCISGGIGKYVYKILRKLDSIYEFSLETIYGVNKDDIDKNKYYISSKDGLCRNTKTNEIYNQKNNIETTGEPNPNTERNALGKNQKEHVGRVSKKAGRPIKSFDAVIAEQNKKEAIKERLHALIDGKEGKGAVLYIKAAIKLGLISKPTYNQFKSEFGDIVSRQNYGSFIGKEQYTEDEMEGAAIAIGKI